MKIAIASSGLGHVARGIETWAIDTAQALHEHDVNVTLFAAAPPERGEGGKLKDEIGKQTTITDLETSTFSFQPSSLPTVVIPCWKRTDAKTKRWAQRLPNFLWRWGLKYTYGIEQFTFWLHLWRRLNRGKFDILHVQDPLLADWCRRFRRLGLVRTKEILAHGTEEPPVFLRKFDYLQQLAPWHLEQLMATKDNNH